MRLILGMEFACCFRHELVFCDGFRTFKNYKSAQLAAESDYHATLFTG